MLKKYYIIIVLAFCASIANANVSLPAIFGDHMVMQQNAELKLWGWGKPLENIAVKSSWSSDTLKTVVSNNGNWEVKLNTPVAGGPYEITIQGYNKVTIQDILMGDVWLCSGQSNMEWSVNHGIINGDEAAKKANHEDIRLFHVTWKTSPYKCIDVDGKWVKCTPETMRSFSAIGYFFGEEINSKLDIPIGLISSNWGGTPIETWIPESVILSDTKLYDAANRVPFFPWAPNKPGYVYNAMLAPIMPFNIKGALWYQGEANVDNAFAYTLMLETLVENWREGFNIDFSFIYAQIAPFMYYQDDSGVKVRDAQRRALKTIPNSAMVILSDIGDTIDIHPRKKIEAGKRFAHHALNHTYGLQEYGVSGPLYKDHVIDKNKVIVSFDFAEGLHCNEKEIGMFEIAGEDQKWYKAKASMKNQQIILSSTKVKKPVYIRYGWNNTASSTLFNKNNLPASSFTTLEWRDFKNSL